MAIVVSFVAASPEYSQVQYPLRSCRYEVYQSHPPRALPGMIGSCLKRLGGTCPQTQNERLQQPIHPKLPFSHPAKPSCWSVKYLVHSGKTLEKVLSKATGIFKLAIGIETPNAPPYWLPGKVFGFHFFRFCFLSSLCWPFVAAVRLQQGG